MRIDSGLEGVVAAATSVSEVDGRAGRLLYRGRWLEEVAGRLSFEEAMAQLRGHGAVDLGADRVRAFEAIDGMDLPDDGMSALRAALRPGLDPVATLGVAVGAWARRRRGEAPVAPDPERGHAADLVRMIGLPDEPVRVKAVETYLVTVMDHGLNASTFTARVVASTGAPEASAVIAALCALEGPLHGGAPGPVLDLLDRVGAPDQAESVLRAELAAGGRIMGMGHRVYRVRDPRAAVLEGAVEGLRRAGVGAERLSVARTVEQTAERLLAERHPDRALKANVEFYTAVLLDAVGLDRSLFTLLFAAGRVVGWTAHIAEQRAIGRLIRPASAYVGPRPEE